MVKSVIYYLHMVTLWDEIIFYETIVLNLLFFEA